MDDLFLTISDDRDATVFVQRKLDDSESLDCDVYAAAYAETIGSELHIADGKIFLGCADFTVEIAEVPQSAVCWQALSYILKSGDE
jgi:hypothetical protein